MSTEDRLDPPLPAAAPVSEEEAWADVLGAWADEAVHRRYLARFDSMEALAVPGGRYRAVLAERPDDAMALKMRGEVLKKATAYGLAALPRVSTEPSKNVRKLRIVLALVVGSAIAWAVFELASMLTRASS